MSRPLDEKRIGLLIRMSFHRVCVCAKDIQAPLVRRGFSKNVREGTYEITATGKAEAKRLLKEYTGKHLVTYRGISIGSEAIIVDKK
jgi:hypothetical protein